MNNSNFLIGPVKDGIRRDVKPFAIPEDAFETLINAYQWRGRVVKRSGYRLLGNLANGTPVMGLRTQEEFLIGIQALIAFDTTSSYLYNGTAFVALPSVMPVTWSGTDYQFFYSTNYANAFWATNSKSGLNGYAVTAFAGEAGAGPYTVNVTAPGNTFMVGDQIYFLNITGPAAGNNLRMAIVTIAGNPTFTVQNTDSNTLGPFVNGATASGIALSTTRTTTGQDGIRYYGILQNGTGWANYNPPVDPNNALAGALYVFGYRGYLVFLNTWEGNDQAVDNYPNRARWTQVGTPYYSEPTPQTPNIFGFDFLTARDDLFGQGAASDAPTNEAIVSAGFIRDILIVYFERSTWRLRFVNNAQNPFVWERINTELGSDCPLSSILFDKGLMVIGNRGILISDGNDTIRFDEKIPDEIFKIRQANNGLYRVNGIRTYRTKLNYWTMPRADNPNGIYPDQLLIFNYETRTWAIFDDVFTCFGYQYPTGTGLTWQKLTDDWSNTSETWDSGISQVGYENVIAGNQQGFVFILEETDGQNDPSLNISAIVGMTFTSINNNMKDGDWITISGVTGTTSSDGVSLNGRNFKVSNPALDPNNFTLNEFQSIDAGSASGLGFIYTIEYQNILPGSIQINIGTLVFKDMDLTGILFGAGGAGTISYSTGFISLTFLSPLAPTEVFIRCVTLDPLQGLVVINTTGAYTGGGQIAKISNIDLRTKNFNFFKDDQKSRLSRIDFYIDKTTYGQFTANIFADSSNIPANLPLQDNPQQNVVLTTINPYQMPNADETIYRLYCDATASTLQVQITYSDQQQAVNAYNQADIEILALMFAMRRGGRVV